MTEQEPEQVYVTVPVSDQILREEIGTGQEWDTELEMAPEQALAGDPALVRIKVIQLL